LPLWITLYVVWLTMGLAGSMVSPILKIIFLGRIPLIAIKALSFFSSLFIIWLIGLIAANIMGKKMLLLLEKLLIKVPFIKDVYGSSKQLVKYFSEEKVNFKSVVLVEFPRKGIYTIGFITNENRWVIESKNMVSVFYPTTPNPTSGFYMLVPEDELLFPDIKIEEAIKVIMSGGVLSPENINVIRKKSNRFFNL